MEGKYGVVVAEEGVERGHPWDWGRGGATGSAPLEADSLSWGVPPLLILVWQHLSHESQDKPEATVSHGLFVHTAAASWIISRSKSLGHDIWHLAEAYSAILTLSLARTGPLPPTKQPLPSSILPSHCPCTPSIALTCPGGQDSSFKEQYKPSHQCYLLSGC